MSDRNLADEFMPPTARVGAQEARRLGLTMPAPIAAEGKNELREALAKYLADNFGEHPVRSMIPWRTEADALLAGPLAPLLAKVQAVEALADELESESRDAMKRVDVARDRADRVMQSVNLRHARVAKHAAAAIRRALGGESRG